MNSKWVIFAAAFLILPVASQAEQDSYTPEQICTSWMPSGVKAGSSQHASEMAQCQRSITACQRNPAGMDGCYNEVYSSMQDIVPSSGSNASSPASSPSSAPAAADAPTTASLLEQCDADLKEATSFCRNPMSAMSDGAVGGGLTQMGLQMGLGVGSMVAQSQGMKQYCDLMKYSGGTVSGLNAALGAECMNLINSCEKSCAMDETSLNSMGAFYKNKFKVKLSECKAQKGQANAMAAAAAQALQGYAQGKLCGDIVNNNNNIVPRDPPGEVAPPNTNCSLDPSNPFCRTVGGPGTGNPYGSNSGTSGGNTAGSFNTGDLPDDIQPGFNEGGGVPEATKSAGVPNGGGGGLSGGGGGGFGGGDEKARGPGAGYNTNIGQGERGGGGYSSAGGGGGGWGGYGQGGETPEKKAGLDLSKYFPGQKGGPNRGPAGMIRLNRDVGAIHEDIFKKMSDRIVATCSGGTINLRDCRK